MLGMSTVFEVGGGGISSSSSESKIGGVTGVTGSGGTISMNSLRCSSEVSWISMEIVSSVSRNSASSIGLVG